MFPIVDVGDLCGDGSILILATHPMDALLGCGGLIAETAQRGIPCHVVMLTGGASVLSALHDRPCLGTGSIDGLRRTGTLQAIAELGGADAMVSFLDLPEGAIAAEAFAFGIAVDVVAAMLRHCSARILLAPRPPDPRGDHAAAAEIAWTAARAVASPPRCLAYMVLERPDGAGHAAPCDGIAIDVSGHAARRRRALEAYCGALAALEQRGNAIVDRAQSHRIAERPVERFFAPET
jgi:LmbE family N-acetylglucosaminyl deacetylase